MDKLGRKIGEGFEIFGHHIYVQSIDIGYVDLAVYLGTPTNFRSLLIQLHVGHKFTISERGYFVPLSIGRGRVTLGIETIERTQVVRLDADGKGQGILLTEGSC